MMPLFDVPGVDFVALQVGPGRDDIAVHPLPANVLDLGGEIRDFSDTAAIVSGLDLVISSCTAPLHLGGAMGVPTWVLTAHAPDWRFHLARSDNPWYPAMRLFRQERDGDWSGAIAAVAAGLARLSRA